MACPYALTQPVGEPVDILEQRPILWSPAGAVDVAGVTRVMYNGERTARC